MPFRTDRVRLAILLKRKSTLTKEEFSQYWSGKHGALFSSIEIVKTNLIKYEQVQATVGEVKCEWDGIAIFDGESYPKIFEVFQDEEYQRVVIPDEANFIARDECQMLPLDLFTVLEK